MLSWSACGVHGQKRVAVRSTRSGELGASVQSMGRSAENLSRQQSLRRAVVGSPVVAKGRVPHGPCLQLRARPRCLRLEGCSGACADDPASTHPPLAPSVSALCCWRPPAAVVHTRPPCRSSRPFLASWCAEAAAAVHTSFFGSFCVCSLLLAATSSRCPHAEPHRT